MKKSLLLFSAMAVCSLAAYAQTETTEPMVPEDEGTVTWTLTPTTADPAAGHNGYKTSVVGNQNNFVKLYCEHANIKVLSTGFELHCGQERDGRTAVYTLTSLHPGYRVTGFSLTLSTNSASTNIIKIGETETPLNQADQTIIGTGNTFTIKGTQDSDNTPNFPVATNISVTLAPTGVTSATPTESGWYKIYNVVCNSNNAYPGKQVYTQDSEFLHNNGYYAMVVDSRAGKEAAGYMYFDVISGKNTFQSPNGHYINENCTSSVGVPSATVRLASDGDLTQIGCYWNSYVEGSKHMVGQTSGASDARWAIVKVSDEELAGYDIWSVFIDLMPGSNISTNAKVSYDNENNKGVTAVYHDGKFFVAKGTTISESDLTITNSSANHDITIDNENHFISVTIADKTSAIATNKFYRIEAKSEGYFYDMTPNGDPCYTYYDPNVANTAIWYYDSNRRLVHYGEGRAAIKNPSNVTYLNKATTVTQNTYFMANTHNIYFIACTNAAIQGRYFVTWNNTNTYPYALLYCWPAGQTQATPYTIGNGVTNDSLLQNLGRDNHNWTFSVEEVTELPVKIGADGKGSLIAPVAVTVPSVSDDFTFYTAKTNSDGTVGFEEVTQGDIPANTPIVIKRTSGDASVCNVTVNYNNDDAPATRAAETESNNRFFGSYLATVAPTPAEGEALYVKCATEGCDNDNDVVFSKVEPGSTIPAGTIAFKAVKDSEEDAPPTMTLDLGAANSGTTSINSIYVENEHDAADDAIYDLQGRRLAAPVRGINIINGKKILVK